MLLTKVFAVASLMVAAVQGAVRYPRAPIYNKSAHFGLKVDGEDAYTVSYARYDYVHVAHEVNKPTEFRIRRLDKKPIGSYNISPKNLPVEARTEDHELVFTVKKPHYYIIKIDDKKEFVVLVDPPEKESEVPKLGDDNVLNVLDFDADASGDTVTDGVQKALDKAGEKPGSIVYVPEGVFTVGHLRIRDKTSLYLAPGSVVRFSGKREDIELTYWKKDLKLNGTWWIQTDVGTTDIKVYGRGTIDGNGRATRTGDKFLAQPLTAVGTRNFYLDGILLRDSAFWGMNVVQSRDVEIYNLKVLNRFDVTQDDGIDIMESTNVLVQRAIAIATDDSFTTKTWPYQTGTTVPYPYKPRKQDNVTFDDCVAWTDCVGFKLGQGVYEDQTDITFSNGVVYKAAVGIGIDHKYGEARADRINFINMDIEALKGNYHGRAGWCSLYVQEDGAGVGPISNVLVKNVKARVLGTEGVLVKGVNDKSKVTDVTFQRILVHDSPWSAKSLSEIKVVDKGFTERIKLKP